MKKLMALVLLLIMAACTQPNMSEVVVVHSVERTNEGWCLYSFQEINHHLKYESLYDECGKFNVGDTLKLEKY
jgi:hypothetical protein